MNLGVLIRGEALKSTRRVGARIALWSFLGILILGFGASAYQAKRTGRAPEVSFPRVWPQLMEPFGGISIFLVALVIIMLTASEFMWRTSRQNVIDGLSKQEWFVGKALNALMVCLVFALSMLLVAAAFAIVNPFTTFMRLADAQMLGAYLIGMAGVASIAFFLAMVLRKEGGALGVLLIWASLGEALIAAILNRWHEGWEKYARYLPFRLFFSVFDPHNFDADMRQRAIEIAKRMHRPPPELPNVSLLLGLAVLYTFVFVAASYWHYSKRDL